MRLHLSILCILLSSVSSTMATVTLSFSDGTTFAKGFANASGTPTDGMRWGVIVDTAANGFNAGSYDGFVMTANAGDFLSVSGGLTDDYFFPAMDGGDPMTFWTTFDTTAAGPGGGVGTITLIPNVPFGGLTNIGANDPIALVWFDSNSALAGMKYGFLSDTSFKLPSGITDGGSEDLTSIVPSGSRTASYTFAGVPEPSRAILLLAGLAGVAVRRRRLQHA